MTSQTIPSAEALIKTTIRNIQGESARLVKMSNWSYPTECGTARCIGGWMMAAWPNHSLGMIANVLNNAYSPLCNPAIEFSASASLFYMYSSKWDVEEFDDLPAEWRQRAAINVLQRLLDTGKVDWDMAIASAADEAQADA